MNIGTPSEASIKGHRSYFKEFLSDPDVIDTNPLLRWAIVNLIVVPFRPKRILPQYQSIWTDRGSPLLAYSQDFITKISSKNADFVFELGMRYGSPSIEDGLLKLQEAGVDEIILSPMFPQYAEATSGSCIRKAISLIEDKNIGIPYRINEYFYKHDFFTDCLTKSIKQSKAYEECEFLLFSFHGLPERQIKKGDKSGIYCLRESNCCEQNSEYNSLCYKHHCYDTVKRVVEKLKPDKPYGISFQSRFGLDAWIKPNTTDVIEELPSKGIKNIAVVCPAFVFDCLETLEEIAIRNNEFFTDKGGEKLQLIPALNDSEEWVSGFYKHLSETFR